MTLVKILHLPTETAGLLSTTANAQKALGYKVRSLSNKHPFGYPDCDIVLPNRTFKCLKALDRIKAFVQTSENFDVYHYYFARTLLPMNVDALYERFRGKRIVTEFFGSDVRLPEAEKKRNPFYVNSYNESETKNRRRMERWSKLTNGEVIFSDHSFNLFLKPYFEKIHIVGQRIDCNKYLPIYPSTETKLIRVMHAPSQQAFKGTLHVERAVNNLRKKGLRFEYVRVAGLPHSEAMELYKTADLIVDQLCGGSHGVFACEAMALGKPVICYILPELQSGFPEGFPIINANPNNIERVLEEWIQSPSKLNEIGRRSRIYAERVHDVKKIARDLIRIYKREELQMIDGIIDWRFGADRGLDVA